MNAVNKNPGGHSESLDDAETRLDTLIVVPCYNEEQRLISQEFLEFAENHEAIGFVFVDDGSLDNTLAILVGLRAKCPKQINVIALSKNSGKAEAVRAGLDHAITLGADVVGYWDADLATPLNMISDFSTIFKRYDDVEVIYGSRKMLMGRRIKRTLIRRAISMICAKLARLAIALPVSDTQCGAKMFRNTRNLQNALAYPFKSGWLFDIELFSRLSPFIKAPRTAFYEFPLGQWDEIEGSKITPKVVFKAGIAVLGLIVRNRFLGERKNQVREKSMPESRIMDSETIREVLRKAA